jgi:hypothetical protein
MLFLCCALPVMNFAADHESVDTDPVRASMGEGTENEAHCGYGNGYVFDHSARTYLPSSAHVISQISALGDEVQFEDGSVWKVSPYDCAQAFQWRDHLTPVSVMQNTSWFSSYNFRIINKETGNSIVTNLFQGPWKGGEKSHYVIEYDMNNGTVKLSSQEEVTHWEIHPSDLHKFKDWNFNDSIPVIIGQNADYDAVWSPNWEGLLINVRKTKCFVRAHQY